MGASASAFDLIMKVSEIILEVSSNIFFTKLGRETIEKVWGRKWNQKENKWRLFVHMGQIKSILRIQGYIKAVDKNGNSNLSIIRKETCIVRSMTEY